MNAVCVLNYTTAQLDRLRHLRIYEFKTCSRKTQKFRREQPMTSSTSVVVVLYFIFLNYLKIYTGIQPKKTYRI